MRLLVLAGCGLSSLMPNQFAGLFDRQYFGKELSDNLDVPHGYKHQGKVASETLTFGLVLPVKYLVLSDRRVL